MKLFTMIWVAIFKKVFLLLCLFLFWNTSISQAQETVFSIFKSSAQQADEYFNAHQYQNALDLYLQITDATSQQEKYYLKIAQCYNHLHQPKKASAWYERFVKEGKALPEKEIYLYAETLSTLGEYDHAIDWYTRYFEKSNDPIVVKKIWRLNNREALYEDSIHYVVHQLSFNSSSADFAATPYRDGVVFVSNRSIGYADTPGQHKVYYAKATYDTIAEEKVKQKFQKPISFTKELKTKYNQGPISFFDDFNRMVYTSSGESSEKNIGTRTLQISFAEKQKGRWVTVNRFAFNSIEYSITDPSISSDGKVLYFSSDMRGGFGGKDIYKSLLVNGAWTKPVNLGDQINTPGDESFPFVLDNDLYFTSNGHPGLGGLDIFQVTLSNNSYGEVLNMGYPVNTNADDFALTLNSERSRGYFSSNRNKNNDDVYSLEINLQAYPLTINGLLQYKEESWNDSTELKTLANAQLFLIDNNKNIVVASSTSNSEGNFTISVPYFSQYKLRVVEKNDDKGIVVSLDLSKQRNSENLYKIVVVKKSF